MDKILGKELLNYARQVSKLVSYVEHKYNGNFLNDYMAKAHSLDIECTEFIADIRQQGSITGSKLKSLISQVRDKTASVKTIRKAMKSDIYVSDVDPVEFNKYLLNKIMLAEQVNPTSFNAEDSESFQKGKTNMNK